MTTVKAAPKIALTPVDSTQICSIGHCAQQNVLAVQFFKTVKGEKVPGGIYHYSGVDPATHEAFLKSESKGLFLAENIKNARDAKGNLIYPFERQPDEVEDAA